MKEKIIKAQKDNMKSADVNSKFSVEFNEYARNLLMLTNANIEINAMIPFLREIIMECIRESLSV